MKIQSTNTNRFSITEPFSDLISMVPNLFGEFGTKRREIVRESDNWNLDRDYDSWDEGMGPGDLGT